MKALSISQPWAWLIVNAGKTIENRKWTTQYRGPFLIHAAKGMTAEVYRKAWLFAYEVGGQQLAREIPPWSDLERGGIVGMAQLLDVLRPTECPQYSWHMAGQYGFVLGDVQPLPFVPCKGQLRFWGSWAIDNGRAKTL